MIRPTNGSLKHGAVVLLVCAALRGVSAVPLENWRLPFYKIAADFELTGGAPSRMFWDEIDSASLFDSALWRSTHGISSNYWHIEPNVGSGYRYPIVNKPLYLHSDIYHEAQFHNLLVRQAIDVDTRYSDDPLYPAHDDRFAQGLMEEALLQLNWKYGFLRIGRQKRNWGPFPDRSLLLSNNPYAYDAVEWQVAGDMFEFRHLFAPFTYRMSTRDSDNQTSLSRYLTAHSLNLMLGRWVTVGITETVVFTRRGGFPDLQYINPMALYTVVNTNQEGVGNLMLGFQWDIHPFTEAVALRGQIVADDFQVDNEKETDKEPAHWGIDAGIYWYNPLRIEGCETLLKLEGAYLSEWIYTVPIRNANNGERYIYGGKSLGFPFNDGMNIRLEGTLIPGNAAALQVALLYQERGGNTELSSWNDVEVHGLPISENRPVERRFAVGLGGASFYKDYIGCTVYSDVGWIQNKNNEPTRTWGFDPSFSIALTLHYSNLFVKLP